MKPKVDTKVVYFLALLTVAPRHGLQVARRKAEYTQQRWLSQRNLNNSATLNEINMLASLWEIQPVLYGTLQGCIGKSSVC